MADQVTFAFVPLTVYDAVGAAKATGELTVSVPEAVAVAGVPPFMAATLMV